MYFVAVDYSKLAVLYILIDCLWILWAWLTVRQVFIKVDVLTHSDHETNLRTALLDR